MAEALPAACSVVVPVFNAFEATRRCLESLARHTPAGQHVVLVDDASIDARIAPLLRDFAQRRRGVVVIENERNLGFPRAANRGMREAGGDVVLLQSDTEVTAGWLEGLARCRASHPAIGIASPLSSRAAFLSLDGVGELYRRQDGSIDVDTLGECVRRASRRDYVRLPTAVGACMLLTRELLAATGGFDPAFGRGHGEDNDLAMRALALGFEIACCDDVYVHHAGEASFGELGGAQAAREANRVRLERRWPSYRADVAAWWRANPLRPTLERVNARAETERLAGRPRVLVVSHRIDAAGGVEEQTLALVRELRGEAAFTIVAPFPPQGAWPDLLVERPELHVRVARMNFELMAPGERVLGVGAKIEDERVEAAFGRLLAGCYDVVHFQSLLGWNSLRLPRLAREAGARVVIGVHDKSWRCAEYDMVTGPQDVPCGRRVARGIDPGCVTCIRSKSPELAGHEPNAAGAWLEARAKVAADSIAAADAIACASSFAADGMKAAFGDAAPIHVIEHGIAEMPVIFSGQRGATLRVAYLGRFARRKGAALLIEVARRLAGERVKFEAWGPIDEALAASASAAGILLRGPYANASLPEMLRGIDLVVVPSQVEESFCLVVSEAQQLGIPVAASAIGAIPERVRAGESGFLFPAGDTDAMVSLLLRVRDDARCLETIAANLRQHRQKTHATCARDYLALYRAGSADHTRG